MDRAPRKKKYTAVILPGILLLAAAVRLWGITYGLPCTYCRPDEDRLITTALKLSRNDPDPHYFIWPGFFFYFTRGLMEGAREAASWTGEEKLHPLIELYRRNPAPFHLFLRFIFCGFGVSTVFFLFRLGKKIYSDRTGLLAAFFLSLSFLHGRDSHFAMLDIPFTMLAVIFFLKAWDVYEKGRWRDYLWAGFWGGLALATKYYGVILTIPFFTGHMIVSRLSKRCFLSRLFEVKFIVGLVLFFAVLFITSPYIILDSASFAKDFKEQILLSHYQLGHTLLPQLQTARGWLYHITFSLRYSMGLLPEVLCLLGTFWGLYEVFRRDFKYLLILSFLIPFYLLIGPQKKPFLRYVTVMLPFLYLLGSQFIVCSLRRIGGLKGRIILIAVVLLISWEPAFNLVYHDRLLEKGDSRNLVGNWIRKNIPPSSVVVFSNPLIFGRPPIFSEYPNRITLSGKKNREELRKLVPLLKGMEAYLIVDKHFLLYSSPKPDAIAYLIQNGELFYSFEAFGEKTSCLAVYDPFDAYYVPLASYDGVEVAGPNILIYRLHPSAGL